MGATRGTRVRSRLRAWTELLLRERAAATDEMQFEDDITPLLREVERLAEAAYACRKLLRARLTGVRCAAVKKPGPTGDAPFVSDRKQDPPTEDDAFSRLDCATRAMRMRCGRG